MLFAQTNSVGIPKSNQGQRVIISNEVSESSLKPIDKKIDTHTIFYIVGALFLIMLALYFVGLLFKKPQILDRTKNDN